MKYIRTKDGIFRVLRVFGGTIGYMNTTKQVEQWTEQRIALKDEVPNYKTADTIEELCDEYVFIRIDGTHNFIDIKEREQYLLTTSKIYGAIWTDKGLIYVAKMNEKGELKLL